MKKLIVLMLILLSCAINSDAQWKQTNGPYGGNIYSLITIGTNLYAGTYGGVFLSTDNGISWNAINNGLTDISVRTLASNGTNIFAGTTNGVFISTNFGASWTAVNN
ncbi:MAG: regulator, partial [Saprospiraceae bacterium]